MARAAGRAMRPSRRRFLRQLVSGAFLTATAPIWSLGRRVDPSRVREIAEALRIAPPETAFDAAAERIRRGATPREMLCAVMLAGVQDVRPWPPGVKFHAVLMVPSAIRLAEDSTGQDSWLPVFFNLQVLKDSQAADIREGDWSLPPAPAPLTDDPGKARRSLADALEAWDLKTADRAAASAVRLLDPDDLFEVIWPIGARDFANIGHLMIHTAQAHRALGLMDVHDREPVVRSLVYGLLGGAPGRTTRSFDSSRKRIVEFPAGWEGGRKDPEVSRDLLVSLRAATPDGAVERTLSLLGRGVAPESIADGLRLFGSEMLFRLAGSSVTNAQLLGVHPMTILNAFQHASSATRSDATRRLLLLQAAAWLPAARDVLAELKGLTMKGPGLDAIEAAKEAATLDQALATGRRDPGRSAALSLRVTEEPRLAAQFIDRCRALIVRKAPEHHHHKYGVALFEEFAATHGRWGSHLLAAAPTYLSAPDDPDSEITVRARAALARAGIRAHRAGERAPRARLT